MRPYGAAFDRFWSDFDRTYSYFDYKKIDWNLGRDQLRERAAASQNDSAFIDVLIEAVQPLRDAHVQFRRPDGSSKLSYVPPREVNYNANIWLTYLPNLSWKAVNTSWGWGRTGDVGYIFISAWSSAVRTTDLDAALEQLRDTRALIIDVRANSGGNDQLALNFGSRFAATSVRVGAVRFKNGTRHTDFDQWIQRYMDPRGSWQYVKPVYLLIGSACFSSNETFIAGMSELPHVTLVGDVTGGSSGNPVEFDIVVGGRTTGWKYSVPRWNETLADGTMIEWNGIKPDVSVPFDKASVAAGRDPVLDWALSASIK
ncbi:MAG TPA: S41 family peptidase [Longimicrobiales bacterium]|nr:S41 family peptidase [Longimicrobiales bacterium]